MEGQTYLGFPLSVPGCIMAWELFTNEGFALSFAEGGERDRHGEGCSVATNRTGLKKNNVQRVTSPAETNAGNIQPAVRARHFYRDSRKKTLKGPSGIKRRGCPNVSPLRTGPFEARGNNNGLRFLWELPARAGRYAHMGL